MDKGILINTILDILVNYWYLFVLAWLVILYILIIHIPHKIYKEEEKLGEEQRDRVQAVVDELSKLKSTGADKSDETDVVTESIESGSKLFNTTPKTLFSAIFINKSKASMNDSASADLTENGEQILAETIATYTLLETIHALGIKSYTEKEVNDLKMEFFIS